MCICALEFRHYFGRFESPILIFASQRDRLDRLPVCALKLPFALILVPSSPHVCSRSRGNRRLFRLFGLKQLGVMLMACERNWVIVSETGGIFSTCSLI